MRLRPINRDAKPPGRLSKIVLAGLGIMLGITATFAVLISIGLWQRTALAQAPSCDITQITGTGSSNKSTLATWVSISDDGNRIAFVSVGDFTGENPNNRNQLFVYDVKTDSFTQVTNGTFMQEPEISGDGNSVVFVTQDDLTGENSEGNLEIFHADLANDPINIAQVTNETGFSITTLVPSINEDGSRVAFVSSLDYTNENPEGNGELFYADISEGAIDFTQATKTTFIGGVQGGYSSITDSGTRIAFTSQQDLDRNSDHSFDVFLYNSVDSSFTNLTFGDQDNGAGFPSIDSDGTRVAYLGSHDPTGENPEENGEFFLVDRSGTPLKFTQITTTSETGRTFFEPVSISGDGKRVAFGTDANVVGASTPDDPDVYLYDFITDTITPLTDVNNPGDSVAVSINRDGTRVAFVTVEDLTGENPTNGRELFLTNCSPPPAEPLILTVLESILVRDLSSLLPPVMLEIMDSILIKDLTTVIPPVVLNVMDSILVSDLTTVLPPVVLNITDLISVADAVTDLEASFDLDGDGIHIPIDGFIEEVSGEFVDESLTASSSFTDVHLGGMSQGMVVERPIIGPITIKDANSPDDGVVVKVSEDEGDEKSLEIQPCNTAFSFIRYGGGDESILTCGSTTTDVLTGEIEHLLGKNATVTQPSDSTATITADQTDTFTIQNSVGSASNVTVQIDSQNPFDILPGAQSTVTVDLGTCGDQNNDEFFEKQDAAVDLEILVELRHRTLEQNYLSDLNGDGGIDILDLVKSLKHLANSTTPDICGSN